MFNYHLDPWLNDAPKCLCFPHSLIPSLQGTIEVTTTTVRVITAIEVTTSTLRVTSIIMVTTSTHLGHPQVAGGSVGLQKWSC